MKRLLFLSFFALSACKKTENTPAGASNGGGSYLSCTINGKNYLFQGKPNSLSPKGVSYSYDKWERTTGVITRDFSIDASDIKNMNAQVHLRLSADTSYRFPVGKRVYFSEIIGRDAYVLLESPIDFTDRYYYADPATGWINITRADSIGAGTFGFTAFQMDNNGVRIPNADSVIVTNGKFDIHK